MVRSTIFNVILTLVDLLLPPDIVLNRFVLHEQIRFAWTVSYFIKANY